MRRTVILWLTRAYVAVFERRRAKVFRRRLAERENIKLRRLGALLTGNTVAANQYATFLRAFDSAR